MKMLFRCLNYLNEKGIRYSHSTHPTVFTARQVASAEHVPAREVAKTVVYFGDNGFGMAVVPADHAVNFGEVLRLMGLTHIRLASETELADLFPDCELGAMPPLGNLFEMPVLVDEKLAREGVITFNAGTHRDVVHMTFTDFHNLVNPLIANFAAMEEFALRL